MARVHTSRFGAAMAAIVLVVVIYVTLSPSPGSPSTADFWCLACGEQGAIDVLANVVLFVPLGFALVLATGRRWPAVLACVGTTILIEALQVDVVVGRDASFSDVLANSLGGWLGAELAIRHRSLLQPVGRAALHLTVAWSTIFVAVCAATSFGLRPAFVPRSLWVQWSPPRSGYEPFTGRLLAFDVDGIDLPLGYPPGRLGLDKHLVSDRWRGTVTIDRTTLARVRSILVRIAEEYTLLLAIEQEGWDLTCQPKTRSADFRFRSPRVALRDAFRLPGREGAEIERLMCERREKAIVVSASVPGADTAAEAVRLSPSLGWALVSPFDVALRAGYRWVSALWLFALAFPAGYWGALARATAAASATARRERWIIGTIMLGASGIAFALVPWVAGSAAAAWWEWGAAAGGMFAGSLLAAALRHRLAGAARRTRAEAASQQVVNSLTS